MLVSILIKLQRFIKKYELKLCKKLLNKYYFVLAILNKIIPKNPKKFIFLGWPDYTGNSMALYQYLLKNKNYEMIWITVEGPIQNKNVEDSCFVYSCRSIFNMLTSSYVFWSNISRIKFDKILGNKKQQYINLWHGMPIKALFNLHINKNFNEAGKKYIRDYISKKNLMLCATSEYWQCVLCACFLYDKELVPIIGQPRNDYIFQHNSKSELNCICDADKYDKIIFFAPTYSKVHELCAMDDFRIIQLPNFDTDLFNEYLKENNILMIAKLHPADEDMYKDHIQDYSNIKILHHSELRKKDVDIDYILGCFDMLITDYSSMYVDYLLADKPILFLKQNYEEYNDKRGFIMGEGYDYFCPGPMISNYEELKSSLTNELKNDNYKEERTKVCRLFHKYTDGKASERICKYLNI